MFSALYSNFNFKSAFLVFLTCFLVACGGGSSSKSSGKTDNSDSEKTLTNIEITTEIASLKIGQSAQLAAQANYSDGSSNSISDQANWTSSEPSVVTVSAQGLALGQVVGTSHIEISFEDQTTSLALNVIGPETLSLNTAPDNLEIGDTHQLVLTGTFADGENRDFSSQANFSSSNDSILSVSDTGLVTINSAGSATVTARFAGEQAQSPYQITVLERIELNETALSVRQGGTAQLNARAFYTDGTNSDVTSNVSWLSSQSNIASISEAGLASALTNGTSQITASYEGQSATLNLSVIGLASLALNSAPTNLDLNDTHQLVVTGTYTNSDEIDLTGVAGFTSSDHTVATVSASGLVTVTGAGSAIVSASYLGAQVSNHYEIIVLNGIEISGLTEKVDKGETSQLSATAHYSDGSSVDVSNAASWSSSNTSVANVSSEGLFDAIGAGTTSISVSYEGAIDSTNTEVVALDRIIINGITAQIKSGDTATLSASGLYTDGTVADLNNLVSWRSEDDSIFTISATGELLSISEGRASAFASYDGIEGELSVEIVSLSRIEVSPNLSTLAIDSEQTFIATGVYSDNTTEDLSNQVTWSSDNTSVATINNTGQILAISAGTTVISADYSGLTGTSTVTVSPATLQTIEISTTQNLIAGISENLSATGTFSDGTKQDITQQLSWSSSNSNTADFLNGDSELTGIAEGSVTITATNGSLSASVTVNVSPATVDSLIVSPSVLSLAKGTNKKVSVTAIFTDSSHSDVTSQVNWSSSNSLIANIGDQLGTVEAYETGTITLTATLDEATFALPVTVTDASLVSIAILPISPSIPSGLNQQFSVTGTYSDGTTQDLSQQVSWSSSNEAVVLIDNSQSLSGLASSLATGESTITARLADISVSTTLSVQAATLDSIEISPAQSNLVKGYSTELSAKGHYTDGTTADLSNVVVWSSNNTTIAAFELGKPNKLEALNEGQAILSAEYSGISGVGSVSVSAATLTAIHINYDLNTLPAGYSTSLSATGVYSDASESDLTDAVTWISSNNDVLTVDNSSTNAGRVRALSVGQSTISASLNGVQSSINIDVSSATLMSINISTDSTDLVENQQTRFTANALYSDNSSQDISSDVSWYSSVPEIASVGTNADETGEVKAISAGTTDIHATLFVEEQLFSSNTITLTVTEDPNAAKNLSLTASPNVILNDGSDASTITAVLTPNTESGAIPDGTEVSFLITEAGNERVEVATTLNGTASITLSSTNESFISITATLTNGLSTESGILSTSDFGNVIASQQGQSGYFDSESGETVVGSAVFLFIKNLSNRDFTFNQIRVAWIDSLGSLNLIDELSDAEYTNNNTLPAGAFFAFGYALDTAVPSNILILGYEFEDDVTGEVIRPVGVYNFAQ